jgi:hypothetical protein
MISMKNGLAVKIATSAIVASLAPGCLSTGHFERARDELPRFERLGVALHYENLRYNPVDDLIFPSVIRTDVFEEPLGKYYMYYAPHDAPGGICLAYADDLNGPWIEYDDNPLIAREWSPHFSVSHVSSAHALWIEEENRMFLWFHGENTATRYASSRDGIHFDYEDIAVQASQFDRISEASYARVFNDPSPDRDGYVMLLMGNQQGQRKIFMARSPDAREWETDPDPVFQAPDPEAPQTSSPWLWHWNDRLFVLAHAPYSDGSYGIYAMETNPELTEFRYAGNVLESTEDEPRVAAPALIEADGVIYLFYEGGRRLNCHIGLAVAPAE